jgi:hypothetical protein
MTTLVRPVSMFLRWRKVIANPLRWRADKSARTILDLGAGTVIAIGRNESGKQEGRKKLGSQKDQKLFYSSLFRVRLENPEVPRS